MEERNIAVADLGTSKIALAIAKVTGDRMEILYYNETPSSGMRHSYVFNPTKTAEKLKEAILQAEKELGTKVTQLMVGKPRFSIEERTASGKTERADATSCITSEEVYAVKNFAIDSYDGIEDADKLEIYGAVPQSFCTEDGILLTEDDVIGMPSSYLEGNFKIFIGTKSHLTNIDKVLNIAGVAQAGQHFLADATARAVLNKDELENGVALIELGAGVTSLSIYKGDILRHYSSIPFGGSSVTMDIKYECGISASLAENIKLAYGGCMPDRLFNLADKIIQIDDDLDGSQKQIPLKELSAIITAREEEIINAILYKIQQSGFADKLRTGIVICGGGAEMMNIVPLIREMSGYNVRIGYPHLRQFSTDGISGMGSPASAAITGLLLLAKNDVKFDCITDIVRDDTETENDDTTDLSGSVFDRSGDSEVKKKKSKPEKKASPFTWKEFGKIGKVLQDRVDKVGTMFDELN